MGIILNYPAKCGICEWDGYEDTVRAHIREVHPGAEDRLKELYDIHKSGSLSLSKIREILKKEFNDGYE
jgi:hypothetical protein